MKKNLGKRVLKVGLITAGGTGKETSDVFKIALKTLAEDRLDIDIKEFDYNPRTYFELENLDLTPEETAEIEERESLDLTGFLRKTYSEGYTTVFRTAVNAGTLYKLRSRIDSVKVMSIRTSKRTILVVRDQLQGFYALDSKEEDKDKIRFECSYSKDKTQKLIAYALNEAKKYLKEDSDKLMVYKYHLFNKLRSWVPREIRLCQPDTGIDTLIRHSDKDALVIAANEVGDGLTEYLPLYYEVGNKATMFAKNVSLCPETEGQEIYQTIHGSADDIAGKGIANPFATLRTVADILENKGGVKGVYAKVENALREAEKQGYVTPDMDGDKKTDEVVDFVLRYVRGDKK